MRTGGYGIHPYGCYPKAVRYRRAGACSRRVRISTGRRRRRPLHILSKPAAGDCSRCVHNLNGSSSSLSLAASGSTAPSRREPYSYPSPRRQRRGRCPHRPVRWCKIRPYGCYPKAVRNRVTQKRPPCEREVVFLLLIHPNRGWAGRFRGSRNPKSPARPPPTRCRGRRRAPTPRLPARRIPPREQSRWQRAVRP